MAQVQHKGNNSYKVLLINYDSGECWWRRLWYHGHVTLACTQKITRVLGWYLWHKCIQKFTEKVPKYTYAYKSKNKIIWVFLCVEAIYGRKKKINFIGLYVQIKEILNPSFSFLQEAKVECADSSATSGPAIRTSTPQKGADAIQIGGLFKRFIERQLWCETREQYELYQCGKPHPSTQQSFCCQKRENSLPFQKIGKVAILFNMLNFAQCYFYFNPLKTSLLKS